jgi:peptidoglycan/xylan/chitin deacetylase (PgdA/CDA1 family)
MKGTFYVTKNYKKPLSPEKIQKIGQDHEIGAHTLNHPVLTEITPEEAEREISGSKEYLEKILKNPVTMFCYPCGIYNENIKKLVKKSGFIAARTCTAGNFEFPHDTFEWQITLHLSNGSPLVTSKMVVNNKLPFKTFFDWELRARSLFDAALKKGGIFHIWGHSWEFEEKNEWEKLERVLDYVAHREGVHYSTNGEIFMDHG